jgi:signal transduction histidine kinase
MVLDGDAGEVTTEQRKLLEEAFVSSQRMVALIEDFLNVSRLQTGRFSIDCQPVDIRSIVKEEVDTLRSTAANRSLTLQLVIGKNIPDSILVDKSKIRQVVMNLIDNAIYYSLPNQRIQVRLSREGGDIRFAVHDKGIGVPKKEQARLFTRFYRANNARKRRPDGTGVGLYLAKRVIDEHGGSMIFRSTEGEGSTFGFVLPIKLPEKEAASE